MQSMGFEPSNPAIQGPQTQVLERAATRIGCTNIKELKFL